MLVFKHNHKKALCRRLGYGIDTNTMGRVTGILLLLSLGIEPATAHEKHTIAVSEIPNVLTQAPAEPGLYNQFLDELEDIQVVFMPPARIEVEFPKEYIDCIFPASTETMDNEPALLESRPLKLTPAFIFTREAETLRTINAGSNIAIRRGYIYGGIREQINANFVELETDSAVLQFLQLGRVDAVISYLDDLRGTALELSIPLPAYQSEQPVYIARESVVCHNTPENAAFIAHVNQVLENF